MLATGVFLLVVQHTCKWILPTPLTWIKNAQFDGFTFMLVVTNLLVCGAVVTNDIIST
jgi:hypothetical protein